MVFESERDLYNALKEVMSWIDNWDVPFLEDDEWGETRVRVDSALKEFEEMDEEG